MRTAPTNKKIREIITLVKEEKLIPRPEFQRRLVWSREDKNHFLDSVLRGYPFPEIYFADGDVDLETGEGSQLIVDGLQRVSTLIQYFEGDSDLKLTTVPSYKDLSADQKRDFLQYDVSVRDLGAITRPEIIEVFKRLNATKYSLMDIEVNNAVYAGQLKLFSDWVSQAKIFEKYKVFNSLDYKRMGDLRFALSIVITMMQGYFNRDDAFEEALSRYNDDFPREREIKDRFEYVVDFIEECGFSDRSRAWKKADLFTLIVELDRTIHLEGIRLQPSATVMNIESFYDGVEGSNLAEPNLSGIYYKAALQASNDRINRVRRGLIIENVIKGTPEERILEELVEQRL